MSKTIKIIESSLQEAVIEYLEARDRLQCHIHLRITPSGECYVAEDAGYCISSDEYNNEPDAEKTVLHQQGWGQHHLPDDWQQTEQSQEITAIIGYITEDLTLDGYDIEWISPQYRFDNGHLYKLIQGAYRHVFHSPYADTEETAIATFESMRANDLDFITTNDLSD